MPKQPKSKLPRATIDERVFIDVPDTEGRIANRVFPVLVIPCLTLKSARQRAKWENLTREEKVERVAGYLNQHNPCCKYPSRFQARAILDLMEGQ